MTRVNKSAHKTVTAYESLMECMYGSEEYILYIIFKLGYSALMLHAIAAPFDRTQSCRNAFSHLRHVHRLCAFCHLIGATGES